MGITGRTGARRRPRVLLGGAALVLVVAAVACRPLPIGGGPTSKVGNDVASCPQFQPSHTAPCAPQPMLWGAIAGPYAAFADGDPLATKCGRDLPVSELDCTSGPYAGGATNSLYDPTGFEYAIDVKPADVGRPLSLQVWDAGSYQRTTGAATKVVLAATTNGSTTINRQGGATFAPTDVGQVITGTGIPAGSTIATFVSASQVTISVPASSSGSQRSLTVTTGVDCNTGAAPFNVVPYSGTVSAANCQTGDAGAAPFQIQLFENDGEDLSVDYGTPIPACTRYIAPGADAATYKNKWVTTCRFTPTMTGIYPVRVQSSGIVGPGGVAIPDTGDGSNGYALRLTNATTTSLYGLGALSINANTPGDTRFYLTDIRSQDAGKTLQIDIFDPGDGNAGDSSIQILGPPSGAPSLVPTTGSTVPAVGLADSCRYNPVAAPTPGPDVSFPSGAAAVNCTVVTRSGGVSHYQNGWLRIQVRVAPTYTCATDCWWTVRSVTTSGSGVPADRMVWAAGIL